MDISYFDYLSRREEKEEGRERERKRESVCEKEREGGDGVHLEKKMAPICK